jgi:hypothetical protein
MGNGGTAATVPDGSGRGVYMRLVDAGTCTAIWYHVATASGNISVAFFANSGTKRNAVPGARSSTSGAIPCPPSGYVETTVPSAAVAFGDWIGISADNVVATFLSAVSTVQAAAVAKGVNYKQDVGHPLPATPSTLIVGSGRLYLMGGA